MSGEGGPGRIAALQRSAAARASLTRLLYHAANVGIFAFPIFIMATWSSFQSFRFDARVLILTAIICLALLAAGLLAYGAELVFMLVRIAAASAWSRPGAICFARLIREREGWSFGQGGLVCRGAEGAYFLRGGRRTPLSGPDGSLRVAEIEGASAAFLFGRVGLRPYLRFEAEGGRITIDPIVPGELSRMLEVPRS